ncbi:hypothetical protein ABW636_13345 [Aquimarina sp. 2201CG1-2-11]|uniref:hypothetical protein n=1 Tax=Aquimarina discodermiae TaxID=3231043 RepID=UPI003462B48B
MADTDGNGKDELITAMGITIIKRECIKGNEWSYTTLTTEQHWGSTAYNFVMDYLGDESDQTIVL